FIDDMLHERNYFCPRNVFSACLGRTGQCGSHPPLMSAAGCLLLALSACSMSASSEPPYLVYFQERSATLDTEAKKVLALVSQHARERPAETVSVVGYTDSAGSASADLVLSQQRAHTVADALVANGVPADRLVRSGRGQTGENLGLASRRVEIALS